jgi:hypothetical protein
LLLRTSTLPVPCAVLKRFHEHSCASKPQTRHLRPLISSFFVIPRLPPSPSKKPFLVFFVYFVPSPDCSH